MKVELINKDRGEYMFWCLGCNSYHSVTTLVKNEKGCQWQFNGNIESPTFTPSIVVNKDFLERLCHSSIADGKIQYHGDCFHSLKNQIIELQNVEEEDDEENNFIALKEYFVNKFLNKN